MKHRFKPGDTIFLISNPSTQRVIGELRKTGCDWRYPGRDEVHISENSSDPFHEYGWELKTDTAPSKEEYDNSIYLNGAHTIMCIAEMGKTREEMLQLMRDQVDHLRKLVKENTRQRRLAEASKDAEGPGGADGDTRR